MKRFLQILRKVLVRTAALAFALELLVGFLGVPGWLSGRLVADAATLAGPPRYVVVLGGGGIPSESGLIRTYYAATAGTNWPTATFVVSLPTDFAPAESSVGRMRDELVLRGIPASSIRMESRSFNTHEQAVRIAALLGPKALDEPVLIVTSSYHVHRALRCFRKAGFGHVAALAAVDQGPEVRVDPSGRILLRYRFWANLESEVQCARELVATFYYKLRGWI